MQNITAKYLRQDNFQSSEQTLQCHSKYSFSDSNTTLISYRLNSALNGTLQISMTYDAVNS